MQTINEIHILRVDPNRKEATAIAHPTAKDGEAIPAEDSGAGDGASAATALPTIIEIVTTADNNATTEDLDCDTAIVLCYIFLSLTLCLCVCVIHREKRWEENSERRDRLRSDLCRLCMSMIRAGAAARDYRLVIGKETAELVTFIYIRQWFYIRAGIM